MPRLLDSIAAAALATCVALAASASPSRYGPFEGSESVRLFPVSRCVTVAREESDTDYGSPILTLARSDAARQNARVRVEPSVSGTFMTVLDPDGRIVAGPELVSCFFDIRRTFWADLNADGKEDFVQLLHSGGCGLGGSMYQVAMALSSERGYRITTIRTMAPGPGDFIDLGDGKCRLVQTSFVYGKSEKGTDGKPHNYWVHNLFEFEGDRVVISKADPRFPKWVWFTHKPNHKETTMITPEQKKRLWAEVPERIFWRPGPVGFPKDQGAVRPRRAATAAGPGAARPRPSAGRNEPAAAPPREVGASPDGDRTTGGEE